MIDELNPVALAFKEIGRLANMKVGGRRYQRLELLARAKWVPIEVHSPMRTVAMAPRRERRKLQGRDFIPVYGYLGLPATDHKTAIAAVKREALQ